MYEEVLRGKRADVVDIDEMWTYVRRRLKDCWLWIWTAVVDGKDLVMLVVGVWKILLNSSLGYRMLAFIVLMVTLFMVCFLVGSILSLVV
jgi:hypothetical protein